MTGKQAQREVSETRGVGDRWRRGNEHATLTQENHDGAVQYTRRNMIKVGHAGRYSAKKRKIRVVNRRVNYRPTKKKKKRVKKMEAVI